MGTNKCMKCFESVKLKQSKQKGNWDFRWSKHFGRLESFHYNRSRLLFAKMEDNFKVIKLFAIYFLLHVWRWLDRKLKNAWSMNFKIQVEFDGNITRWFNIKTQWANTLTDINNPVDRKWDFDVIFASYFWCVHQQIWYHHSSHNQTILINFRGASSIIQSSLDRIHRQISLQF